MAQPADDPALAQRTAKNLQEDEKEKWRKFDLSQGERKKWESPFSRAPRGVRATSNIAGSFGKSAPVKWLMRALVIPAIVLTAITGGATAPILVAVAAAYYGTKWGVATGKWARDKVSDGLDKTWEQDKVKARKEFEKDTDGYARYQNAKAAEKSAAQSAEQDKEPAQSAAPQQSPQQSAQQAPQQAPSQDVNALLVQALTDIAKGAQADLRAEIRELRKELQELRSQSPAELAQTAAQYVAGEAAQVVADIGTAAKFIANGKILNGNSGTQQPQNVPQQPRKSGLNNEAAQEKNTASILLEAASTRAANAVLDGTSTATTKELFNLIADARYGSDGQDLDPVATLNDITSDPKLRAEMQKMIAETINNDPKSSQTPVLKNALKHTSQHYTNHAATSGFATETKNFALETSREVRNRQTAREAAGALLQAAHDVAEHHTGNADARQMDAIIKPALGRDATADPVAVLEQISRDKTLGDTFQAAVAIKRNGLAENQESDAKHLANAAGHIFQNIGTNKNFAGVPADYATKLQQSTSGTSTLSTADLSPNRGGQAQTQGPALGFSTKPTTGNWKLVNFGDDSDPEQDVWVPDTSFDPAAWDDEGPDFEGRVFEPPAEGEAVVAAYNAGVAAAARDLQAQNGNAPVTPGRRPPKEKDSFGI
jgi:hypothetical protein